MNVFTTLINLLNPKIPFVEVLITCENHVIPEVESLLDFRVEEVSEDDLRAIIKNLEGTGYPESIARALRDGSVMYVAKNKEPLGFTMLNREFITITNGVILQTLKPGEAYSYLSYVFPQHRGKKVFQKLKQVKYQKEFSKGTKRIYSVVEIDNKASIKAQEHLGVTKKQFVWLVDRRELKKTNKEDGKPRHITSRIIYEDDPLYHPLCQIGRLIKRIKDLKKKMTKNPAPRSGSKQFVIFSGGYLCEFY